MRLKKRDHKVLPPAVRSATIFAFSSAYSATVRFEKALL